MQTIRSRSQHPRRDMRRGGFSLAELAVVVMIVGILAGVAVPAIQSAVLQADAAHILGDVNTVRNAAYQFLSENGRFPASAGAEQVPAEFIGLLPEGFRFRHKNVVYSWYSYNYPDDLNAWGSRTVGRVIVHYNRMPEMADPMLAHQGPDKVWTESAFYFIYRG